ncbi:hypothetical protein JWJ90_05910 [Desulfobulbus rhabdoformis]|uniref:hypothetical protein n=1 Tax=Desulfobulbus rhabdoformis TaxID=34032 RepID=UPI0019658A9B|nr:hypothetical protein [Desulfobulbus rhabdoformis]MBM9613821.1 hypothetical protein [Desulfobulbus rhabdoformis]
MQVFYFIFEVEPQVGNPKSAHASRAVAHLWVPATNLDSARESAKGYLADELWQLNEEKAGKALSKQEVDELKGDELIKYQAAQTEGIQEILYYWHRSE